MYRACTGNARSKPFEAKFGKWSPWTSLPPKWSFDRLACIGCEYRGARMTGHRGHGPAMALDTSPRS